MPAREGVENKTQGLGTMNKILILHGWSYSTEKWEPFLNLMSDKDLNPQLLGIPGLTEPTDRVWTLEDYVEWLKEKVGQRKAILIGHSNGGRLALAFALKYPERVKHLVLIDSAGIRHNELPIRFKRFVFKSLAKFGKKLTTSEAVRSFFYKLAGVSDYKEAGPEMLETMVNLISVDLRPDLHRITTPTLIIWGGEDKITPFSDAKLMYELIPNSRIHVIKGARHSPQFTHPKEVCAKIVEWIQQV